MFKPARMTPRQLRAALIATKPYETCSECSDLASVQFNDKMMCGPCAAAEAMEMQRGSHKYGKKTPPKFFTVARRMIKEMKGGTDVHIE